MPDLANQPAASLSRAATPTARARAIAAEADQDLSIVNRWLCHTRLRSSIAFSIFVSILPLLDVHAVATGPVVAVCLGLCVCSWIGLKWQALIRRPLLFFHIQNVVDLVAITIAIAVSEATPVSLLLRSIYLLVIVPASLVSVSSGIVVAALASCCHLLLLHLEHGLSLQMLASLDALLPMFLFGVIANQAFFYSRHLERKNVVLAQLAEHLDDSRARLSALVDVARTLNSTLEPAELLARVNRAALMHLGADWSATFLVDNERGTIRVAALSNVDVTGSDLEPLEFPASAWPVVARIPHERLIALSGAEAAQTSPLLTGGAQFATVFLAGLYRDRDLLGFLALGYDVPPNDARISQQLSAIAEHAAIALCNAQLLNDARQASALKSEFLSTVSHELRTPINVITGFTEMLRDGAAGPLAPKQQELLNRIDARGRELFDLVETTLHVGRIETGRDAVTLAPVHIDDLVHTLQTSCSGLAQPARVTFQWNVPATLRGVLVTDAAKVGLIVRNLVSNAFKFTSEGHVEVRLVGGLDQLSIDVSDTGVGIAPEQVDVIFEMFRQLDNSPTRQHGGVGLGLYIVKQVVERLNGSVSVESTVGCGSTFHVVLPRFFPDTDARPDLIRTDPSGSGRGLAA